MPLRFCIPFLWVITALSAAAHDHATPSDPAEARMEKVWSERLANTSSLAVGLALDSRGRLWLARVENRQLRVSHSEDGGASFSAPVVVTPETEMIAADRETRPKIAVSGEGRVHLAWGVNNTRPMTGSIRYARSVDGGKSFSRPVTLNDDGLDAVSHGFDSLAIDGHDRVAVVWLDGRERERKGPKGSPATGVGLYAALSMDGGASFAPNRKVADHTCQCCRTGLAWTAAGPVAYWRHVFGRNLRDFAIADLNGGAIRRVTNDDWEIDACPHHGGGIVADDRDNLHITWFTNGKKRQGIFYRRVGARGMSEPMALGDPARQASHPAVVATGERVLLSWREFDGQRFFAMAMLSRDRGVTWSAPQQLAETAQAADYTIPLVDERHALVAWNTAAEGLRLLSVAEAQL